MAGFLKDLFIPDPNFDTIPESNFIERGISNGIERGFGKVGDNIINAGKIKSQNMVLHLPDLAGVILMVYLIYLGYRAFLKREIPDFSNVYTSIMIYTIFRLFWKVILHI